MTPGSTSTSGCAPVNARSRSTQPRGVIQSSQPAPVAVSAITLSRKNTATAPRPSSSASRREDASWLTTAPRPANTGITQATTRAR